VQALYRRVLATATALTASLIVFVPGSGAARAANLSLYVSFFPNGSITLTAPDGSAIGTTSGTPTVIPAGFYTLVFSGPGGCTLLPNFRLSGPSTSLVTSLTEAQGQKNPTGIDLLPSSTYTWSSDGVPGVVHTFATSAQVEGSPPAPGTGSGTYTSSGKHVTSQDLVGSAVAQSRGTLRLALSPTGKLALAYQGKGVERLKAGKYRIVVSDASSRQGLVLQKLKRPALSLTKSTFTGSRTTFVTLTTGSWLFAAGAGTKPVAVTVR